MKLATAKDVIDLKIYVDNSIIEVFIDNGQGAICAKNFGSAESHYYSLSTEYGVLKIIHFSVKELYSIFT